MPDRDGPSRGRRPEHVPEEGAVASAVFKLVGIAVVIGLLFGGGIFLVVSALGIGGADTSAASDLPDGTQSRSPLPSVALTPSSDADSSSSTPSPTESESPSESSSPDGKLTLSSGQAQVAQGERIDLTGQFPGKSGTVLQVQRRTGGSWEPFSDVTVRVQGDGSFSTYVVTSRSGEQNLRVLDRSDQTASNPVTVTVGG